MRRNIFFIASLMSCLLLVSCNCNCSKGYLFYKNSKEYQTGDFTYQKLDIKNEVEINWVGGSITIIESDNDTLSVTENSVKLPKDQQVHWLLDNGKLTIHYAKSGCLATIDDRYKDLIIEIPKGVELSINTVSADICSKNVSPSKLDINSVSADLHIDELKTSDFSIDIVSGNVNISKIDADNFTLDTVSGMVNIEFTSKISGKINSVSGNVHIVIPKAFGFVIDFDSISGDFISDIPYARNENVYRAGTTIDVHLEIDTTSANAKIRGE